MRTLILIYGSLLLLLITNSNLSAQIPGVNDLILNVSKMSQHQQLQDAKIFEAYGREPYIPNKVDPTLNFELAKKKLRFHISQNTINRANPAYYNTNTKVEFKRRCKNVVVTNEYLQFTKSDPKLAIDTVTVFFKDILNCPIIYFTPWRNNISVYTKVKEHEFCCAIFELPDVFYYIQQYYSMHYYPPLLATFKPTADQYQLLTEKPVLLEDQRKYFLQANQLAENGDYFQSIELYEKGITINPISYPPAYYNLALIAAMSESYPYAIYCMKKYLMLVPNIADANIAQDKIYGWEVLCPNLK
jgi:tetratricopeptide (TPR) repeat protein